MTWLRRQQRRRSGRTPQACKNQTNGHQPGLEGQVASMNDISISSISANLGLGGLLTDQTLTLATEYGLNFVAALITVIIGIWASRRLSGLLRNWLTGSSRIDQTLTPILAALVRYAILTLTVVVTLGNFGVETTSIIAVLGAAGLAIGLALQGTLSNVAAGLMILFLRPFKSIPACRIRRSGHRPSSTTRAMARGGWISISASATTPISTRPRRH